MKYIEIPALNRLAQSLSHEGPECSVNVRMEAYSCKNIKRDKKLFKALEEAYSNEHHPHSESPPLSSSMSILEPEITPFGPFDNHSSRKTLYLLISTLNIAFPDHEFSDVRPAHFNREENGASVLNALSTTLVAPHRAGLNVPRTYSSYPSVSPDLFPASLSHSATSMSPLTLNGGKSSPFNPPPIMAGTHPSVYRLVDDVIGLEECEVYSYTPEIESDPHAVGDFDSDEEGESEEDLESSTGSGWWDDNATFEFDDYDVDEHANPRMPSSFSSIPRRDRSYLHVHPGNLGSAKSSASNSPDSPTSPQLPRKLLPHRSFSAPNPSRIVLPARDHSMAPALAIPYSSNRKSRGALLWSSHWFFLNRKQKRVLFISVWARSRGVGRAWDAVDEDESFSVDNRSSSPIVVYGDIDGNDELVVLDGDGDYVLEKARVKSSNISNSSIGKERFLGWEGGAGAGARAIGLKA